MEWQRYRLPIMAVVALAMVGLTWWTVRSETGDTREPDDEPTLTLPEVDRDAITELEIRRPDDEEPIRLVRDGESWRVAAPVDAAASSTTIGTALDKLADLEVTGRAASNAHHHERLEVDEEHGIRVMARAGDETAIDVWIGAFRAGNTMVRVDGQDEVLMVRGSIKFAFNKPVRDWRERTITDESADDVIAVSFRNEHGAFDFQKRGDAWEQVVPQGGATIEGFDASKLRTTVASLTRLRATDFAESGASPESLGFGPEASQVVLTLREATEEDEEDEEAERNEEAEGGEAEATDETETEEADEPEAAGQTRTITVLVGNQADDEQRYVMLQGGDVIYVVSRFIADRLLPNAEAFAASADSEAESSDAADDTGGAGGGGQLPPEVMQQIQRQLQQQGGGHP